MAGSTYHQTGNVETAPAVPGGAARACLEQRAKRGAAWSVAAARSGIRLARRQPRKCRLPRNQHWTGHRTSGGYSFGKRSSPHDGLITVDKPPFWSCPRWAVDYFNLERLVQPQRRWKFCVTCVAIRSHRSAQCALSLYVFGPNALCVLIVNENAAPLFRRKYRVRDAQVSDQHHKFNRKHTVKAAQARVGASAKQRLDASQALLDSFTRRTDRTIFKWMKYSSVQRSCAQLAVRRRVQRRTCMRGVWTLQQSV